MVAQNICNGLLNPVSWEQSLNEDSFKIDTREPKVYDVFSLLKSLKSLLVG